MRDVIVAGDDDDAHALSRSCSSDIDAATAHVEIDVDECDIDGLVACDHRDGFIFSACGIGDVAADGAQHVGDHRTNQLVVIDDQSAKRRLAAVHDGISLQSQPLGRMALTFVAHGGLSVAQNAGKFRYYLTVTREYLSSLNSDDKGFRRKIRGQVPVYVVHWGTLP